MQNPILFFNSISASNINEVGGKGANLGELSSAGFNVPDGFCVTAQAYSEFIRQNQKQLYKLLKNIDSDNLDALRIAGKRARNLLGELALPKALEAPLKKAWETMGKVDAYAVRSSATAEDLPQASFAGQQDTYLNIIGIQNLRKSIKDCFISLYTDRAILYRVQNNFDHKDVQLCVVVQKMILPQASGIMFTADPVNGNRDIISIDASYGIGEALVSGLVSADLYKIEKSSNSIFKKKIGDKKIAIIPIEGGGTKTVNLNPLESAKTTLNDNQIITLTKLGKEIEKHFASPQDIEWALADSEFYITQSRPITSLYPLPKPDSEPHKIYISLNHFQMMTDAMPPLSLSLFRSIIPVGRDEETFQSAYVQTAGGRLYGEFSSVLSHPIAKRLFPNLVSRADHLVGKMAKQWVQKNSKSAGKSNISVLKLLPIVVPFMWQVRSCLFGENMIISLCKWPIIWTTILMK